MVSSLFLLFAAAVSAHMNMDYPPIFGNTESGPLLGDGSDFPCRGLDQLSTATNTSWVAGTQQKFTLKGGAPHEGGSCQASISEDGGETFKVIHSYIGNCPLSGGSTTYEFEVPLEAKRGNSIFAWTWFNLVGNREMYMNCAGISINGTGSGLGKDFPDMFVANIGRDCKSNPEGTQKPGGAKPVLEFPNPGKRVTRYDGPTAPPEGACAGNAVANPGKGAGSGSAAGGESGAGSGAGAGTGAGAGSGADSDAGSGAGSGAGVQPTQTYDDGMWRPTTTPAAAAESGSGSGAGVEKGVEASSGTGSSAALGAGVQSSQTFDDGMWHTTYAGAAAVASSPTSVAISSPSPIAAAPSSATVSPPSPIGAVPTGSSGTDQVKRPCNGDVVDQNAPVPTGTPNYKRRVMFRA